MTEYNIYAAKTHFSKLINMLENKEEDLIIISKNGKPIAEMKPIKKTKKKDFFGCAKGMFTVPDDFDEIDISGDFKGEIF